ncbi:MAG: hypothetical protein JWP89_2602 [Schlesneria sp.]|nr:hypothetical protein [Schlesneria sp.]
MTKRARSIWIEDDDWADAGKKADQVDRSISNLVAKLLRDYVPAQPK